jgi:hypothetical protein
VNPEGLVVEGVSRGELNMEVADKFLPFSLAANAMLSMFPLGGNPKEKSRDSLRFET